MVLGAAPQGSEEGRTGQRERLGCDASLQRPQITPQVALKLSGSAEQERASLLYSCMEVVLGPPQEEKVTLRKVSFSAKCNSPRGLS